MDYRREVDGLRALAVVPVILFHAGYETFSGGFVGVDVFFVISGYLITTIILTEHDAGRFSLIAFYDRRARRILPALFAVMLACLPFAWAWLMPNEMKDFSQSVLAVSGFSSNILFWLESGYFGTENELKPLLHTWSLAVEEQYYVLFPLFLLAVWKFGQRRLLAALVVVFLVSFTLAEWASVDKPTAAFFLLPTRGWELMIGAFIAFYFVRRRRQAEFVAANKAPSEVLGIVGVALIAYAVFAFDDTVPFPGAYALIPTVGTALIILFASPQTVAGRLLGLKPLVGVGLISYSAYLWHQPLFAFARNHSPTEPSHLTFGLLSLAAIGLAYVTWRFVETPFRNKRAVPRRLVFASSLAGMVLFGLAGYAGHATDGFVNRLTAEQQIVYAYANYDVRDLYKERRCFLDIGQTSSEFAGECRAGEANARPVMVWGDSHAAALTAGMRALQPDIIQYTTSSCPPVLDAVIEWQPHCKEVNAFVMSEIGRIRPAEVYLHANWWLYNGQYPTARIAGTIRRIRETSPDTEITVVGGVPQWGEDLPNLLLRKDILLTEPRSLPMPDYQSFASLDGQIRETSNHNKAQFFSPIEAMCNNEACQAIIRTGNGLTLSAWDYGHLTEPAAIQLAQKMLGVGSN